MKDIAKEQFSDNIDKINTTYDNILKAINGKPILRYLDKIDCDYIKYDFNAKNSGVDKETILYHFRNQLLEINNKFRVFAEARQGADGSNCRNASRRTYDKYRKAHNDGRR